MRKAKIKVGNLVEVPEHCFAPGRSGWNGWLFTYGIIQRVAKNKNGEPLAVVLCLDKHHSGKTYVKNYLTKNCFDPTLSLHSDQRVISKMTIEELNESKNWRFRWLVDNDFCTFDKT